MDVAERAVLDLAETMRILGVSGWTLPNIREKFVESTEDQLEMGRTGLVTAIEAEIVFDDRFKTKESQKDFEEQIKYEGFEYPGMTRVFKHELAHLAMWSVTGLPHQPAVRIIDEGWATLVEYLGTGEAKTVAELADRLKSKAERIKRETPEVYYRCLDLAHPVSERFREDLNGAEYIIGAALLLWVYELKGLEAMIDLIRKAPSTSRRTSTNLIKIPAALKADLHVGYQSYQKEIVEPLRRGNLTMEEAAAISEFARGWEAAQFRAGLLEITGYSSIEEAGERFESWLS